MRFSIIIPIHNGANRIGALLDTIKAQTFTDYEILAVCDSCEDDSEAIAESYGARVFQTDAHNSAAARNVGLDYAVGDFILFADDDDRWMHRYVLEQIDRELNAMEYIPDVIQCSFVFGDRGVTITGNNRIWPNVWSKIWKRSAIGHTRFRLSDFPADDLGFVNQMLAKGITVEFLPLLWYDYNYMRPGSITWGLEQSRR